MVWGYSMFKDFLGQIIRMKKIIGLRYFESVFMLNWGPNEQSETKKVWQNRETFVLVRVFNLVFQTSTVTICYCPPTPGWMEPGPVRPRTMQWTALKQVWKGCYVVAQELVRVSSKLSGSMKLPNITLAGVSWNPSSHNSDRTIKCASLLGLRDNWHQYVRCVFRTASTHYEVLWLTRLLGMATHSEISLTKCDGS